MSRSRILCVTDSLHSGSSQSQLVEIALYLFNSGLCLPSGPSLTDNDIARVARIIRQTIAKAKRNRYTIRNAPVIPYIPQMPPLYHRKQGRI